VWNARHHPVLLPHGGHVLVALPRADRVRGAYRSIIIIIAVFFFIVVVWLVVTMLLLPPPLRSSFIIIS
jgi:hypothetical protein